MTVNDYIKKLQMLQPKLREKDIVIAAPNGIIVTPDIKMLLEDEMNVMGGIENVKAMIITY